MKHFVDTHHLMVSQEEYYWKVYTKLDINFLLHTLVQVESKTKEKNADSNIICCQAGLMTGSRF